MKIIVGIPEDTPPTKGTSLKQKGNPSNRSLGTSLKQKGNPQTERTSLKQKGHAQTEGKPLKQKGNFSNRQDTP